MCPAEAGRAQCPLKPRTLGRGIHLPPWTRSRAPPARSRSAASAASPSPPPHETLALNAERPRRRTHHRRRTKPLGNWTPTGYLAPTGWRSTPSRDQLKIIKEQGTHREACHGVGSFTHEPPCYVPTRTATLPEQQRETGPTRTFVSGENPFRRFLSVREGGVEPPRPFGHWNLNPARLPIPPPAHWVLPPCPSPFWRVPLATSRRLARCAGWIHIRLFRRPCRGTGNGRRPPPLLMGAPRVRDTVRRPPLRSV